ncbi:hypothetical protein ACWGI8_43620 [Streptomyces sp. NPDC054841]
MQRVLDDCLTGDEPAKAVTETLFGLSALSGILLQELSEATGTDQAELLSRVHSAYLNSPGLDRGGHT